MVQPQFTKRTNSKEKLNKKENQFQWHQSFQIFSKTVLEKGNHANEKFINKSIPRYVQARMVKLY